MNSVQPAGSPVQIPASRTAAPTPPPALPPETPLPAAGLPIDATTGPVVEYQGRQVVTFGGCNYLGLAQDPRVVAAALDALRRYGLSTSASRQTTGNTGEHEALEHELAAFLDLPAALVVPDGYTANLAAAQALAAEGHTVGLADERAHRSIFDAFRVAGMRLATYRHLDAEDAAKRMRDFEAVGERVAVMSDTVFATDGALSPARELLAALPENGTLVLDDCHGLGVMGGEGSDGRGTHFELLSPAERADPRLAVCSSLAKGAGGHGGFVAGRTSLVNAARRGSSAYVCTTPASPLLVAAVRQSLRIIRAEPERVRRLRANAAAVRAVLREAGIEVNELVTPTIAFVTHPMDLMPDVRDALFARDVQIPLIDYPNGPCPRYFRLSVSSQHTPDHIAQLRSAFAAALSSLR